MEHGKVGRGRQGDIIFGAWRSGERRVRRDYILSMAKWGEEGKEI